MDYITERGVNFSFAGFAPGDDPLTNFDAYKFEQCLHGCMVLVYLFIPVESQYKYLSDDGLLHELIHLILGIDICTHNSTDNIRQQIRELMHVYSEAREYFQAEAAQPVQLTAD